MGGGVALRCARRIQMI